MNFLAHIYLSGDNDLIKIGNFMADGIRGNNLKIILWMFRKELSFIAPLILLLMPILFLDKTKKLHSRYHHYAV
jgi:hypothetical protein